MTAISRAKNSVAIVGMSCIFPGAPTIAAFWENISKGIDSVREPNEGEWNSTFYKSKSKSSFGNIYCSKGGFITEYAQFDPLEFGIMPASLRGADPDQFLALRAASEALQDAGYDHKTFDGERAEIVIGRTMAPGVGSLNLIQHGQTVDQVIDVLKAVSPQLDASALEAIANKLRAQLQPCNADTIPAVMPNVLSGRIASKLGFRGRNLVLDAACASSLIAVEMTMQSLLSGQSDLAIAGGVHINSSPYFYQMFCELGALSNSGTIRPFDDSADGTILGEGVGMVVLKRLEDALQDGNKIYALIRGIGSSSDGRGGGSLAPNADGEALAMKRAYNMCGVSPRTVEMLEAHGTGTRAGDRAEMKAVEQVFGLKEKSEEPWCAIGSVKSMIGHTQAASGIAGLIKTALALHHKTIPQTLHFENPSTQIKWDESPCYVITKTKAWKQPLARAGEVEQPRRAAVSSFGFGGINAHAILEEHSSAITDLPEHKSNEGKPLSSKNSTVTLSLAFPALNSALLSDLQLENKPAQQVRAVTSPSLQSSSSLEPSRAAAAVETKVLQANIADQNSVLRSYIQTLGNFHQNAMGVQESVMLSYLNDSELSQAQTPKKK